jgi:hypothetical protein
MSLPNGAQRVQQKFRHRRKVMVVLQSLGLTGIALGVALLGVGILKPDEWQRLMPLGALYVAASLILLALRAAFILWGNMRRRRYSAPDNSTPGPHARRAAPAPVIEEPVEPLPEAAAKMALQGGAR